MILRTMLVADAVLAIVDFLSDDQLLRLEPYQNGREHGWSLYGSNYCQVAFSEYRNSDAIVVYAGKGNVFSMQGNVPTQEIWETRHMFEYDCVYEAARFIVDFLSEQKVEEFREERHQGQQEAERRACERLRAKFEDQFYTQIERKTE